jgi:hypothetical protein
MKRYMLVVVILGLAVLVTGCSGGAGTSATSSTDLLDTTTTGADGTNGGTVAAGDLPTVLHEQTEYRFTYGGVWTVSEAASASGGDFVFVNASGGSLTVRFAGTHLSWIAKKSPKYGQAAVTVDGGSPVPVDLYSAEEVWQQTVWETDELSAAPHVVTIAWTGQKSADAEDTNINVDAIEVTGVLTGRLQQTDPKLIYAGDWKASSSPSASGGNFAFTNSSGATVTVHFDGLALAWVAKTSPAYGEAQVSLDGGSPVTVDLYSAEELWQQEVWNSGLLGSGSHTVIIQWTGRKNDSSTDTNIDVDCLDVTGTLR